MGKSGESGGGEKGEIKGLIVVVCYDEVKDEEKNGKGLVEGSWVLGFNFFAGFKFAFLSKNSAV